MIKKILIVVVIVFISVGFIGGVVYLSTKYLNNESSNKAAIAVSCEGINRTNHAVIIENNKVIPEVTNGKLCDTMTITNKDDKNRDIAFGQHDQHVAYDGVEEETLAKDKSLTVTLNKAGDYIFHDHDQDEVKGSFMVVAR